MQLAGLDARHVEGRDDAADDRGELIEARGVQVLELQRLVGGAEVDRLGLDLLDAAARADRLVVQAVARLGLIGLRPLGVDRRREGRARARDIGRGGRAGGAPDDPDGQRRGEHGGLAIEHLSLHPERDRVITPRVAIASLRNAFMTAIQARVTSAPKLRPVPAVANGEGHVRRGVQLPVAEARPFR